MEQKFMCLSKRWISFLCCISLVISVLFPNVNVFARREGEAAVRYSVLILDTSGSMRGTPKEKQKEAAIKFCESVLKAKGENKVALVTINSSSSVLADFTSDMEVLKEKIEDLYSFGGTNINEALAVSNRLLEAVEGGSNVIKNIILCTDGLPESGDGVYEGPYSYNDYTGYGYANAAYETAQELKKKCSIYSLGFFHSLSGEELTFARKFMNDLQNAGYYEVTEPNELKFKFGDIADDITEDGGAKKFYYDNGYSAICFYKDDYFKESSYGYNPSLATMSLSFAMSAFANGKEVDYKNKSTNAKMLLKSIVGVSDDQIEVNSWYTKKPETDSIGVIIGNKKIEVNNKQYTLIALAIRGGGYEREWASNFTIGETGQHLGFDTAKNNVLQFLKTYIANKNIKGDVKLWITGYSRAAATANLVGGAVDNGISLGSGVSYKPEDVYTYCFETPAGALTETVKNKALYYNIYNIINFEDPVPYVAPSAFGFSRYGIDRFLPSRATTSDDYQGKREKMLEIYKGFGHIKEYSVDNFKMKAIKIKNWLPGGKKISVEIEDDNKNNFSQGLFLSKYVTLLSKDFLINRRIYVKNYQDEIREICKVYFGASGEQAEIFRNAFIRQAKENWKTLALAYILIGESNALKFVSLWLRNAMDEAGIKDYDEKTIERAGVYLSDLLLALISNHPNYFTTLVYNIKGMGEAHYPELCFSWLASMDKNYSANAIESFSEAYYRIIRINCDVDVDVSDKNGVKLASIVNEIPQNLGDKGLISGVNEDGEKYVVLPADADYQIKITARSDDTVNYGINEYSAKAGEFTRVVNYFDIGLSKGKSLKGELPSYSRNAIKSGAIKGSETKYVLKDSENKLIQNYVDLAGKDATNAYYSVDISSIDSKAGAIVGGGIYQYGSYAQVSAVENDGYGFNGWYEGNRLLSKDKKYRFCVKADKKLVAKFDIVSAKEITAQVIEPILPDIDTKNPSQKTKIGIAKVKLGKKTYAYDGKAKLPKLTVQIGNTVLKEGTQYQIEYKNNQKIGTATVVVSGTGDYIGSISKNFTIVPKGTSLLKVFAKKKTVSVNWKKKAKFTTGYQLQHSTSKKFIKKTTKNKFVKNNKRNKLILSNLKANKKYYIRIRTYKIMGGKKYYSSWSKVKTVTMKK